MSRSDEQRVQDILNASGQIGLRVVLAHHYHRVDPNQVWVIAEIEVARLAAQLGTGGIGA